MFVWYITVLCVLCYLYFITGICSCWLFWLFIGYYATYLKCPLFIEKSYHCIVIFIFKFSSLLCFNPQVFSKKILRYTNLALSTVSLVQCSYSSSMSGTTAKSGKMGFGLTASSLREFHSMFCFLSSACICTKSLQSCPSLCNPMDYSPPLSMGFSRQAYWSGLPCPPPRDLPDPGIEPMSLMPSVLAGGFFTISTTWEAPSQVEMPFIPRGLMKKEFPFDFLFKHLYSLYNNKINGDSQNIF